MQCQIRKALSDSTVLCGHLEPNIVGQVLNFHPGFQDKRTCSHWKITYWFVYSVLTPNDNHVHYTVIGYNIIDTHAKVRSWSSIFFSPLSENYELHLRSSCWVAQSLYKSLRPLIIVSTAVAPLSNTFDVIDSGLSLFNLSHFLRLLSFWCCMMLPSALNSIIG